MSNPDWIGNGSARLSVLRLLSILKHFYTFKELEDLLGIPYQRIWRYISLMAMPEKSTAEKIMNNIREKKLIERILSQTVRENEFEVWRAIRNIGSIELIGFLAMNMLKNKGVDVNAVLSFPDEYSATIATVLSEYLGSCLCIASRNPRSKDAMVETYTSKLTGNVELIATPRGCIKKKSNVLLVTFELNDFNSLYASMRLVERGMANTKKLFAVVGRKNVLDEMERMNERIRIMVLKMID